MLKGDVINAIRVRPKLIIRAYNTKGGQDTRKIQVHPKLKEYLAEYDRLINLKTWIPGSNEQ
ncbi:integrase/recombinase [Calothrix brevissima NIES-22]|nr:integrase/recombinase [Calothrix brevissima NIES-22]